MDELQKQIDYLTQEDLKNKQEINKLNNEAKTPNKKSTGTDIKLINILDEE